MDELDKIIEASINKVTRLYLGEQVQEQPPPQQPPPQQPLPQQPQNQMDPNAMGMDPNAMGMGQPPNPKIEELDVDKVAPNPDKVNPPPAESHYD